MRFVFSVLTLVTLVAACAREPEPAVDAATAPPEPAQASVPDPIAEGLQTPESVLYDPDRDVYYISNINGAPLEADGNGFISRVNAASGEIETKWIDGAMDGVRLDAPKGMGVVADELWVTDITTVRRFDIVSGAARGEIPITGATFLNDIAVSGETVWISDTGFRASSGGFEPSGTEAIYRIERGRAVEKIASGEMLGKPNGLVADGGSLWVVTFGSDELFQILNGEKSNVTKLPQASLDGLVLLPDGDFLVSSWDGSAVYRGRPGGAFAPVLESIDAPADIGFDSKRNLVLVPHFNENRVSFHRL